MVNSLRLTSLVTASFLLILCCASHPDKFKSSLELRKLFESWCESLLSCLSENTALICNLTVSHKPQAAVALKAVRQLIAKKLAWSLQPWWGPQFLSFFAMAIPKSMCLCQI
jgi:hypothetical protein